MELCSSCGEWQPIRYPSRNWCNACYLRWHKAGRPDTGPAEPWANRLPRVRACVTCGQGRLINGKGMCRPCYSAWYRENLPARTCAGCGLERKPHAGDLCMACYRRRYRDYDAEASSRQEQRDRLDTLRISWAVTHPGEPGNPYECGIADCHATANPGFGYLCMKHYSRIYRTGRHDRDPCVNCGRELNNRGDYLCSRCYPDWRYCDQPAHQGGRLLSADEFGRRLRTHSCRECTNRSIRKRSCQRCGSDRVRQGSWSLCQECGENWFYCGSAVHDGARLVPLEETHGRENGTRRCKQCSAIRRGNSPRKILACLACGEEKPINARGWCGACYRRWRMAGRPDGGPPPPARVSAYPKEPQPCPACGETRKITCNGWCNPCYSRWIYAGKPEAGPPPLTYGRKYPKDPQPCTSCGQTRKIATCGWCATCYQRWRKAGRPDTGPPPSQVKPKVRACAACGGVKRIAAHDWCDACYVRWTVAGRPKDGPPPPFANRKPRVRPCLACGQEKLIQGHGWCAACHSRWAKVGRPESGPPAPTVVAAYPKEPQPCPSCGETKRITSRSWCRACYERWRNAGKPESGPPSRPAVKTLDDCLKCGKPGRTKARGWCGACYARWRRGTRKVDTSTSRTFIGSSQVWTTLLTSTAVGVGASGRHRV